MITMGVDASTTSTGWSIFDGSQLVDYGVIKPEGTCWRDRLIQQGPLILEILKRYNPQKIYLEDVPLKSQNAKALLILGAVQGFLYGVFSTFGVNVCFLQPNEWRSKVELYDGTREGTKRTEMKHKSIIKANQLFDLDLQWVSPNSKKNQDDEADAILICYSQVQGRKFGRK